MVKHEETELYKLIRWHYAVPEATAAAMVGVMLNQVMLNAAKAPAVDMQALGKAIAEALLCRQAGCRGPDYKVMAYWQPAKTKYLAGAYTVGIVWTPVDHEEVRTVFLMAGIGSLMWVLAVPSEHAAADDGVLQQLLENDLREQRWRHRYETMEAMERSEEWRAYKTAVQFMGHGGTGEVGDRRQ